MDGNFNNNKDNNYRNDNMEGYRPSYQNTENAGISISPEFLEKTSKWAGFLGIVTIVSGALTCLGAITTFGLSLIPGIINIILGLKLNKVKGNIQDYLRGNSYAINDTFDNMGSYFKIQGILMIVGFALAILGIIFFVIVGFSAFNGISNQMYY